MESRPSHPEPNNYSTTVVISNSHKKVLCLLFEFNVGCYLESRIFEFPQVCSEVEPLKFHWTRSGLLVLLNIGTDCCGWTRRGFQQQKTVKNPY